MHKINHWIPARAGITVRAEVKICQARQRGCRHSNKPCRPPSSFQRKLESRKMQTINHWIPARAGMTVGAEVKICQARQRGCRNSNKPCRPPSSFQRKLESRKMQTINHWIPARAGMTVGLRSKFVRHGKGAVGIAANHADLHRHSSESWNPEKRRRGNEGMAGFIGCPRSVVVLGERRMAGASHCF